MYFGMDIGGSNIRIAGSKSLDNPALLHKAAFPNSPDYDENIEKIIETIRSIDPSPDGVGLCIPGKFKEDKTMVIRASYVSQYANKPIVETLRAEFRCPVTLGHDTATAGLGEALYGTHIRDNFCFLIYGTGTGAAFITFQAGKPNSQNASDEDHAVYLKPWQSACGGRGIEEKYGKPAADLTEYEWSKVMDDYYGHLTEFVEHFRPSAIVYGGGIANKQWPRLQNVIDRLHVERSDLQCDISLSVLGEDVALYGAFGLIK